MKLNDQSEALAYLRRYSVAVGDDVGGLLRAADSYLLMHRYDEAFELANRVRERTFHERAQRIVGLVYMRRGEYAKAIAHLDKADADAVVVESLLRCRMALADLREVPELLEKADKFGEAPESMLQEAARARKLVRRQREMAATLKIPDGKEAIFRAALDAFVCAAQAQAEGQSPRKVEALLAITFAANVDLGPAYGLRGRLLMGRGKLTAALAAADKAIKLAPHDADGYYVRGRVRLERQQLAALADLEKAAEYCERKDAEVLHCLADALFQAGRREDAVKTQREAVQLKPQNSEFKDQLAAFESAEAGKP